MPPSTSTTNGPIVTISFQGGEYTGTINEQNEPHGKGTIIYPYTKHKYEGEFINGKAHGKGIASGLITNEMSFIINNELRDIGDKYVIPINSYTSTTTNNTGDNSNTTNNTPSIK
ncbi:predicted protein [Naegleria gruberi]|uniref:Predicted protein n=1 Tax=Naegleria gruberi TaxID=5762 RepID=D2VRJ7_NAEGR|nr:uncharacterized protein NAEGRDRAFT_71609 [Naegleria gruberi]EFC40615.1 predicted protein [Naegleria gruberi]|eukprot:XP_002673359.1 predicted protein [Naegleria gruberi strain NEG-M]